jgi:hypothetical protein
MPLGTAKFYRGLQGISSTALTCLGQMAVHEHSTTHHPAASFVGQRTPCCLQVPPATLADFEAELGRKTAEKEQRAVIRTLLGLAGGEQVCELSPWI